MKLILFAVLDKPAKHSLPPFCLKTEAEAERTFADAINNPKHHMAKHPSDYTLYSLGTYDDETGEVTSEPRLSIGNGAEYQAAPEPIQMQSFEEEENII